MSLRFQSISPRSSGNEGRDGAALLEAIYAVNAAAWLPEIPAVQIPRHVWVQNYVADSHGSPMADSCGRTPTSSTLNRLTTQLMAISSQEFASSIGDESRLL